MTFNNEDVSINSIIGVGSTINGDIKVNGFVRIDGDIDGNLETTGNIIVGEKARIQGNVIARAITVGGVIKGNITASESVDLLSTSVVIGDIVTHRLQADENVVFNGHCIALTNEDAYDTAVTKWQNMQTITSHSILQSVHVSHDDDLFHRADATANNSTKDNSFVEETVQDITLSQDIPSNPDTIPNEAIPAPATSEAAENKPSFIPINLGEKMYSSTTEQHPNPPAKKE